MERYLHTTAIHNRKSPKVLVPEVLKLINPKSVVDVGCGTGTFLAIFQDHGIDDILGLEGEWIKNAKLEIDAKHIMVSNLEIPVKHWKRFDLAICLEVVEHLKESSADTIINTLTNLSDVVLFSAAVPGQTGQNHVNEQWVEYWQEKFRKKGYQFYDEIRWKVWNNHEVDWWYKQNIFFVIKEGSNKFSFTQNQTIYNYIHPELLSDAREVYRNLASGKMGAKLYIKALTKKLLYKSGLSKKY
jgi:SAM-dependent methyltransferase